jgi:Zn-dependent protease with chaperone function
MRSGNDIGRGLAARFACCGLAFLLCGCLASPALGQTRLWPVAALAHQPAESAQLRDARGRVVASVSRDLMRELLQVQDRMQQQAGFAGELVISDGRAPNAFAANVRGRSLIGVTAPMLDLLRDDLDAYAALLGHEIAHHVQRHGQQRQSREQSLGIARALFGLALGAAGVRHAGSLANLGTAVVSSSYTRDEERDADRLGVDWMAAAGFDPEGALRLHERLLQSGRRGIPIPFLQTHPTGEERMARIRQQIAGLAPTTNAAAPVIEAAAPAIEAGTPQSNWPPPDWLPVVPPAEEPAIAAPFEFAAGDPLE